MSLLAPVHKIPLIFWLLGSAAAVVAGDYFAKKWSIDRTTSFFWLSVILYAIASQLYLPTLLKEGLVVTSILWTVISSVGFIFIGIYFFQEHLTVVQWVGVGFGFIAVCLLAI